MDEWLLRSNVAYRNEGDPDPSILNNSPKQFMQPVAKKVNRFKGSMSVRGFPMSSSLQNNYSGRAFNLSGYNNNSSQNLTNQKNLKPLNGSNSANILPKLEMNNYEEVGSSPMAPIEIKKPIIAKIDSSQQAARRRRSMSNIHYS